jgi:hypothetical protein
MIMTAPRRNSVSEILFPRANPSLGCRAAGRRGFLKWRVLAAGLVLGCAFRVAAGETPDFAPAELDVLIENARLPREGSVEMVFKKIRFDAALVHPPAPRRTQYLMATLRGVGGAADMPEVTQGMDIASASGKTLNVYVEDGAAARAKTELKPGQRATFYGYHIYDSPKHGPGILVSGHESPSRLGEWYEAHPRLKEWGAGLGRWLDRARAKFRGEP